MSWSRSITGNPEHVKHAASLWADEQRGYDQNLQPQLARDQHLAQVQAAADIVGVVASMLESEPTASIHVTAWGHHSGVPQSASGGLTLEYHIPVPVTP